MTALPNKLFPMIVTDKLAETKRFYLEQAGFEATIDMEHYLQVRFGKDEGAPELCFMPSGPTPAGTLTPFDGQGVLISIPTQSADEHCDAMKKRGATIDMPPADMPWGWRSFHAKDPNGVVLDFFHVLADKAKPSA